MTATRQRLNALVLLSSSSMLGFCRIKLRWYLSFPSFDCHTFFHDAAKNVDDQRMRFLDSRSAIRGYADAKVQKGTHVSRTGASG